MNSVSVRLSSNEKEFIEAALRVEQRVDGRRPFDARRLTLNFSREDGVVEVQQGQTRVMAVVKGELAAPYPDRPTEGSLAIYIEFSPLADPSFEYSRPGEMAVELGRIIDRGLRESRAVDTESLCVLAGRAVWALRVDIHVLDNGGNLIDVANIAALASLLSYRRPDCTMGGKDGLEVIVHAPEVRDPIPLILHHLPIAVTFAFFADGELEVLDPSLKEEAVMGGRLTVTMNAHGDICAVQKGGGVGVKAAEIMRCFRIASSKVVEITSLLKKEVETHDIERAQRKIKRHFNHETSQFAETGKDLSNAGVLGPPSEGHARKGIFLKEAIETEEMEESSSSESDEDEDDYVDQIEEKKSKLERPWIKRAPAQRAMGMSSHGVASVSAGDFYATASAAEVYAQGTLKTSLSPHAPGPVLPRSQFTSECGATAPTSLLDAVKNKDKKRKKASTLT